MRDALGPIYGNAQFADLFPHDGQPARAPAQRALVTIMQFAEGLADRPAADAVQDRLAWKYALGLELTDPGFDASVLCEFRARLIEGNAEYLQQRCLTAKPSIQFTPPSNCATCDRMRTWSTLAT